MTQDGVRQLTAKEKLALAKNSHGLMARVARKCDVDPGLVSRVLRGINVSKRVSDAIDAELGKEIRKQARWHAKFKAAAPEPAEEQANGLDKVVGL